MLGSLMSLRRGREIDCLDVAVIIIKVKTGDDLSALRDRSNLFAWRSLLVEVDQVARERPALVQFRRDGFAPHVGVIHRGKVTHLKSQAVVTEPLSLARRGWDKIRYYQWQKPS